MRLRKSMQRKPMEYIELSSFTYPNDKGRFDYRLMTMEGDHKILHREPKSSPWVISRFMVKTI